MDTGESKKETSVFLEKWGAMLYELRKECVVGKIRKQMSELVGDRERNANQQ